MLLKHIKGENTSHRNTRWVVNTSSGEHICGQNEQFFSIERLLSKLEQSHETLTSWTYKCMSSSDCINYCDIYWSFRIIVMILGFFLARQGSNSNRKSKANRNLHNALGRVWVEWYFFIVVLIIRPSRLSTFAKSLS